MDRHRVPLPLKKVLRDTSPDELALQRMWTSVRRRSSGAERPRRLVRVTVMAAAAAVLLGFGLGRWGGRSSGPDPLYLADRTVIPVLEQPGQAQAPLVVQVTDGSRISLDPGTRLEPLDNSGPLFRARLRHGRARLDVRSGDARRWIIEAGGVSVEITGSKVAIYHAERRCEVEVYEGAVMVRGPGVTGGAQRLGAGQALNVEEAPASAQAVPASPAQARHTSQASQAPQAPQAPPPSALPLNAPQASRSAAPKAPQPSRPVPSTADSQHPGDPPPLPSPAPTTPAPSAGPPAAPAPSNAPPSLSAEDLIALADMARQSGRPREALPLLDRVVSEHPHDPRAALAAFTRGRIEFDDLAEPAHAATSFRQALTLAPPQALAEDIYARLIEALLRADQRPAAEAVAAEYRARFPAGRYRERMQQWLDAR
ncbi:MAG TPA: FecR domain-containing protein [Polyangia bacterium]|jgi:hypothetical protein|nr:FecR domain-containing protein [Polyangia bacterium]